MDSTRAEVFSGVDATWLGMDDPTNRMINTGALFFDEPLDFGALREVVARRLLRFPRFRQRVVHPALPLVPPCWEVDPLFDLDVHLHHTALPAPGDQAALQTLVGDLLSTPLDPSRPLWQLYLVDNFGGGCGLLARLHHCVADGAALVQVLRSLADHGPVEKGPPPAPADRSPDRAPLLAGLLHSLVEELAHKGIDALFHPARTLCDAGASGAAVSTLGKLLLLKPDPPTALRGSLGVVKRAAWSGPVPLRQVRALGQTLGGTGHEVLLCALAGALRRYLRGRGQAVSRARIRAAIPVNLRPGEVGPELGNVFGLVLLPLPVHEGNVARRLSALKKHGVVLHRSGEAEPILESLRLLGLAPGAVGAAAMGLLGSKASVVISTVLGPHRPVSVDGKLVRQALFWVPQAGGLGLGLSLFCYAGAVTLGVASDAGLVPDPGAVVSAFEEEIDEMDVPGRCPGGRPARATKRRRARASSLRKKTKSPPDEQDSPP